MKKFKTNKLFFNKWPYKVACYLTGASMIKYMGSDRVKSWCNNDEFSEGLNGINWVGLSYSYITLPRQKYVDKIELFKFTNAVEQFLNRKHEVQIRVENAHFNIFCKDTEIFNEIVENLSNWIIEVHEPDNQEEYNFLMQNQKQVLCDNYPHGKFKHKVVFKHDISSTTKFQIINYLDTQHPDSCKISRSTQSWFRSNRYIQDPFIYVADSKMLTFLMLITSSIKRVDNYVIRNSIVMA